MARPKKTNTLEKDVAELKNAVALLLKHLTPTEKDAETVEVTPRPPLKKKGRKTKEIDAESDTPVRVGASKKLKERGKSKTQSVPRPFEVKRRPNLFDKMMERTQFKEDTIIDKKLWKGKQVSPRGGRTTLVSVDCVDCGDSFSVSPNEVVTDSDGDIRYVCDDCLRERQ